MKIHLKMIEFFVDLTPLILYVLVILLYDMQPLFHV